MRKQESNTHLGQTPSDSTGLLSTEVKRELLALVELAEVGASLLVDDGEASGNRLANDGAVNNENRVSTPIQASRSYVERFGQQFGRGGILVEEVLRVELDLARVEKTEGHDGAEWNRIERERGDWRGDES